MQVQILYQPFPSAPEYMETLLDKGVSVGWGDPLEQGNKDFDVLVAGRPNVDQLRQSQNLSAMIIPFAGIPAETRQLLLERFPRLAVYNLHHNAVATAEMAMALLMAVAKNLMPADRAFRNHDWRIRYKPNQNLILSGSTALILGYGAVGKNIARMCQALDMKVLALQRSPPGSSNNDVALHQVALIDSLLPEADIVFIALPLTLETENLLNKERLGLLREHCILVNVARAAVVDETALYEALRTKAIAGAGIDVWYQYPKDEASRAKTPPADHPFHQLDNVVMSPHRGGGSRINERLRLQHLAEVINTLARGDTPLSRVNVVEGY
jgi:phosphoglycerate dehydrogenase-like enzyme